MNISIICSHAHGGYGGIALYNSLLIDSILSLKKINLVVYSKEKLKFKKKLIQNFHNLNKFLFFFKVLINFRLILKSDFILCTHLNYVFLLLPALLLRKKVILFTYGLEVWGNNFSLSLFLFKNFFYKFVSIRPYTANVLKKKYRIKKKVLILNNAFKFDSYKINHKTCDLITIARLEAKEPFKGIDEALEVLKFFNGKNKFKYHIVGNGTDFKRLYKKSKQFNLKNVIFHGKVSEKKKHRLLKKSKIMIMAGSDKSFDKYPFRFSFLEACNHGLFIIGSSPTKAERVKAKSYRQFLFVQPKNYYSIYKKVIYLQKKRKFVDQKLIKDFSISKFRIESKNIIFN